jgi:acetyl-CoA acetyltransferase
MQPLKNQVAIVGVGTTPVGRLKGENPLSLTLMAGHRALADAGLTWQDIDGVYTTSSRLAGFDTGAAGIAEHVGIHPSFTMTLPTGGMQFASAIAHGAAVVHAGLAKNVILICADALASGYGSSATVDHFADTGHLAYETPFGTHIPSLYALIASRHMYEFGTRREDLAAVAVQMRKNASQHPDAERRDPITIEDVLNSKPIASPFNLLDCALISDGGAAFILTSTEHARDLRKTPVLISGTGEGRAHLNLSQSASLTSFGAVDSGRRALSMADMSIQDIDVSFLYDAFSIMPIIALEALGYCKPGEGGAYVSDGLVDPVIGPTRLNPHGGALSFGAPGRPTASFHIAEAVAQLRGEARGIQVPGARTAIAQVNAGIYSGEITLVLTRDDG